MSTRTVGALAIACVVYLMLVIVVTTARDIVTTTNVQYEQTGDQR